MLEAFQFIVGAFGAIASYCILQSKRRGADEYVKARPDSVRGLAIRAGRLLAGLKERILNTDVSKLATEPQPQARGMRRLHHFHQAIRQADGIL